MQGTLPATSSALASQGGKKGAPLENFEIVHRIGEGTYGRVFLAKTKAGQYVAIKTLKAVKEGEGISVTAIREAMLLKELHHPNILHLVSVQLNRADATLSLVFEFADLDLFEMIQHHKTSMRNALAHVQHFPPDMVKSIMWQLLQGLDYLHQNWIIHRDLKPSNLLIMGADSCSPGQLKIADFGLARVFRSPSRPLSDNGVVVTIWYRAPELLLGAKHYTPAVDLWAAACIFGELLTLKPLFHGEEVRHPLDAFQANQLQQVFSILGPPDPVRWPDIVHMQHWSNNTDNIRANSENHTCQLEAHLKKHNPLLQGDAATAAEMDLMLRLLEYDPQKRLTAAQALEHEYFKQAPLPSMNAFTASLKARYTGKLQTETAPKARPAPTAAAAKGPVPRRPTSAKPVAANRSAPVVAKRQRLG